MYTEAVAVGKPLPDMPVFLRPEFHVLVRWSGRTRRRGTTIRGR